MKKTIINILTASILAASSPFAFADAAVMSDWSVDIITQAKNEGWISDTDAAYDYTMPVTRESFCDIVFASLASHGGCPDNTKAAPFSDTSSPAVNALYNAYIINGTGKNMFSPNEKITREQAAAILLRLAKYMKLSPSDTSKKTYADENSISDWAAEAVHIMDALGIMNGTGNNEFSPRGDYTYEQTAATLLRLYAYADTHSPASTEGSVELPDGFSFTDALNAQMPHDENYVFSPLSVKLALAMAANGAEGQTKDEILKTLGISDLGAFNEYAKGMISDYSRSDALKLSIANSIWKNTSYSSTPFSRKFTDTISAYYDGAVKNIGAEDAAEINEWVSEKTNGIIPSAISSADFDTAIINAVYFKGKWINEFSEDETAPGNFTDRKGNTIKLDFMHLVNNFSAYTDEHTQMISLPYMEYEIIEDEDGDTDISEDLHKASMYLIMSDSYVEPENIIKNTELNFNRVTLSLPKFKAEFSGSITPILKKLGISKMFDTKNAQLSQMTETGDMYVSDILHKTHISIDEKGTEAAAVASEELAAGKPEEIEMTFDRPFTFVVYDETAQEVLFAGEYGGNE